MEQRSALQDDSGGGLLFNEHRGPTLITPSCDPGPSCSLLKHEGCHHTSRHRNSKTSGFSTDSYISQTSFLPDMSQVQTMIPQFQPWSQFLQLIACLGCNNEYVMSTFSSDIPQVEVLLIPIILLLLAGLYDVLWWLRMISFIFCVG